MPLPMPRNDENRSDFINRCMDTDAIKTEFGTREQRLAVCYRQWGEDMEHNILVYKNLTYEISATTHQGRDHIIVPVIMMVEGVHNGSHGPLLHTQEELSKFPEAWNGRPVVIGHPMENGHGVCANTPEITETERVGTIYDAYFDTVKMGLRAKAWLDIEKLEKISPEAYGHIINQKPLDVSVGVFSDKVGEEGDWNGESYSGIAANYRPDHLALLPGESGACSWADGCGVRLNKEKGGEKLEKQIDLNTINVSLTDNSGYKELLSMIQTKLDSMDTNLKTYFLEEVYDDYFVYRVSSEDSSEYYKSTYTKEGDVIEFQSNPTKVVKQVDYVELNNEGKEKTMSNKEAKKCCPEKVDLLIQSDHSPFTDQDKEWLEVQEENIIDKLVDAQNNTEQIQKEIDQNKEKEDITTMKEEDVLKIFKGQFSDKDKVLQLLPEEMAAQMKHGMELYKKHRSALIDNVLKATDVYTAEELEQMGNDSLEKLGKAVKVPTDYSLNSDFTVHSQPEPVEPLVMGIELDK